MNDLSEKSKSYYDENTIYKVFSDAEDKKELVLNHLKKIVKNKKVLDLGCGNGKYLTSLNSICDIYGIDLSFNQLKLISHSNNIVCADAVNIPFKNNYFDVIFSCWMFGTILDENKRLKALNEAKRVLKKDGILILIENAEGSEFEKVRGRYPDILNRTENYNNWLLSNELTKDVSFDSYFEFESKQVANDVFYKIWKDRIIKEIDRVIEHKIDTYVYKKF